MAVDTLARTLAAGMGQNVTDVKIAMQEMEAEFETMKTMVGAPLVAATSSAMTDHNKIYVYTGSQAGYTYGHWYYWNGSAWADGGVYNSIALETDKTLSVSDMAADAKVTGTDITGLMNIINGSNGLRDIGQDCIINSNGVWTQPTAKHVRLLVKGGDTVNITGGSLATTYGFLKSKTPAVQNTSADFSSVSGYTSRITLSANATTGNITAPSDAVLLYIAVVNNSSQNQSPTSVIINGVEMVYNIRKKIDSLSADVGDLGEEIQEISTRIADESSNAFSERRLLDLWGMRTGYDGIYAPVDLSSLSFLDDVNMELYNSGYKVKHNIDLSSFKNTPTATSIVNNQSDLQSAIGSESVNTIIVKSGRYTGITINKSVNIIGEEGTIFAPAVIGFTTTSTAGTYRTSSNSVTANPVNVYQIADINTPIFLTHVGSVSDVTSTPGSWFWSQSVNSVYVHLLNEQETDGSDIVIAQSTDTSVIKTKASAPNAKIYLEKITVIGGKSNIWAEDATSSTAQKLVAKDCKFFCASLSNALSLRGVNGYFQNCECAYAKLDGFNYHKNDSANNAGGDNTGILSNGLEVDCIGHDNGITDTGTSYSDNGSTCHDGGKMLRINGVYYNNKGGNVADTSSSTVSYNYGCYAFDSTAPVDTNRADFWAQNGTQMYLYGCRSAGDSQYNLWAGASGATIHTSKCEYTTTTGTITPV